MRTNELKLEDSLASGRAAGDGFDSRRQPGSRERPPQRESLRALLKSETADAHRALESLPLMREITCGVPTSAAYRAYLIAQWQVHNALEDSVRTQVPDEWRKSRLVKTGWLESDLNAFQQGRPAACVDVPRCRIRAQAIGAMYVMEGATLGLGLVTRHLPPGHPALGTAGRFMAAYGSQTGPRWTAFLAMLEAVRASEWGVVCGAANDTFGIFHRTFKEAWA